MKKIMLVLFMVLAITSVSSGADWKLYAPHEYCYAYYDAQSITHSSKNIVRVCTRWDVTEKGVMYMMEFFGKGYENMNFSLDSFEINCVEKKYRTLSSTKYDKDAKVIDSIKSPEGWHFIDPGTINEALYKKVCR